MAVTVGVVFTVTVTCAVEVQPFPAVPVTVYVIVVVGETEIGDPEILPGFQTYVDAPPPVRLVELPVQIVGEAVVAVTVGEGLTVMVRVAVPEHPEVVPVTVYVVVVAGETVIGEPEILPGFQT